MRRPEEIIFTSGGTESNNYAIRGLALARANKGRHIITSRVEHPAVTAVCRQLETEGFEITWLPVDGDGLIASLTWWRAIRPDTILITLMHANNEVGTIQPIREAAEIARGRGISLHTDAAQSVGKIPTDVKELEVDLLSVAGHKLYAPKGVGALYVRDGVLLHPLMRGAGQERGRRPGTENVLEIVGLGAACGVARRHLAENTAHMRARRDELEDGLSPVHCGCSSQRSSRTATSQYLEHQHSRGKRRPIARRDRTLGRGSGGRRLSFRADSHFPCARGDGCPRGMGAGHHPSFNRQEYDYGRSARRGSGDRESRHSAAGKVVRG